MKITNFIKLNHSTDDPVCLKCTRFENDPKAIEKAYPGLKIMSSGFASVRDSDGFCNFNQLYLSAWDSCPHFIERSSVRVVKKGKTNGPI